MPSTTTFNPDRDIPSLTGKTILITGGTAGLGAGTITELANHNPSHILFTGRNTARANHLISTLQDTHPALHLTFFPMDISSLASIASATKTLTKTKIDILILNAGIMATTPSLSPEGYEIQFATNYLGHALLVKTLLPQLLANRARVVSLTSTAFAQASGIDFATLRTPQADLGGLIPGGKWARYSQSKLAQLLWTMELARRYPALTAVSVHPGVVYTGLFDGLSFTTRLPVLLGLAGAKVPVEEGHWNQCWAATSEGVVSGEYYEPVGVVGKRKGKGVRAEGLGKELWEWTERELEGYVV